jgi:type II secretory pathway component GspD/PulD (secretin)
MKKLASFLLLIALSTGAFSQNITKISFENQEIRDILGSLGKMVNRTVVMDDTVSGRATYFFNEMDFVEAVRVFADAYDLYVQEQDGVLLVSRISVEEKGDQIKPLRHGRTPAHPGANPHPEPQTNHPIRQPPHGAHQYPADGCQSGGYP